MKPLILSFAVLGLSVASSQAAVALNSNIALEPGLLAELALTVYQDEPATDPTSIFFDYNVTTITYRNINLDEGSEWYFADAGDRFEASTILAGDFVRFAGIGLEGLTSPIPFGDFYVAVNTGNEFSGPEPNREVFGWALLRNTGTELQLVGSAVTYDQPGIVVGTSMTIPEPATPVLAALALSSLLRRRRRS